jgi:hypothetical protein
VGGGGGGAGGGGGWGRGGGGGPGGEMTQAVYAHMNNKIKKKEYTQCQTHRVAYIEYIQLFTCQS